VTDEETVRYWLGDREGNVAEVRHAAFDRIVDALTTAEARIERLERIEAAAKAQAESCSGQYGCPGVSGSLRAALTSAHAEEGA
jgi:hypothetical protein